MQASRVGAYTARLDPDTGFRVRSGFTFLDFIEVAQPARRAMDGRHSSGFRRCAEGYRR